MAALPDDPQRSVLHGREAAAPSAIEPIERSLLLQARSGVQRLPGWMFSGLDDREQLALALVFEAKLAGLTRIDDVVPSASGTVVFAVQGHPGDPGHRRVYVSRAAMARPDDPATPPQRSRSLLT